MEHDSLFGTILRRQVWVFQLLQSKTIAEGLNNGLSKIKRSYPMPDQVTRNDTGSRFQPEYQNEC